MAVVDMPSHNTNSAYLRAGWASTEGFKPFFGSGGMNLLGGVGDDFSSVGFDGRKVWAGGHSVDCNVAATQRKKLARQAMSLHSVDFSPVQTSRSEPSDGFRGLLRGLKRGDVVGCLLDLQNGNVNFTLNGKRLSGSVEDIDTSGTFYPVVSLSAGIK